MIILYTSKKEVKLMTCKGICNVIKLPIVMLMDRNVVKYVSYS
jgi:hypothetical protein